MEEIYMKARAKLNLNLLVLNKRKDNYHNLKSVFQKINLYDEIYVKKTKTNNIDLRTNIEELNNDENIIYKTYQKLKNQYKNIGGIQVVVNKKIPMQAGLAGGSTDCASFILCMNKLFNLKLTKEKMENIGKSLGADVIPCFYNRAVLVEGIGDIITEINTNFKYYILIVKPNMSCNTKELYQRIDESDSIIEQIDKSNEIITALKQNKVELFSNNLYNIFEQVIEEKNEIKQIKEKLIKNEAIASSMTGSGSCVFGIFKNKQTAKSAYNKLKNQYQTYICTSYNF